MPRHHRLTWLVLVGIVSLTAACSGGGRPLSGPGASLNDSPLSGGVLPQAGASNATPTPQYACSSSISSNFNGTPISPNDYIWFSSVFTLSGVPQGTQIDFDVTNSSITWSGASLYVPNAMVLFSSSTGVATTVVNYTTESWDTELPTSHLAGNDFLTGAAVLASGGPPAQSNPVTWNVTFQSTVPGLTVQWAWAAAVYSKFATYEDTINYNSLGVKPVDDNQASEYPNSDHAGTPESYRSYVVGGAMGGGGANYTGGLSGTTSCQLH